MEYLTCNDVARDLGLGKRAVQKYIKEGFLPASFSFKGSKKQYEVNPQQYIEWRQQHYPNAKRGNINKYTRLSRPLTLPEIEALILEWLETLKNGTLNGQIYSQRTIDNYAYFMGYFFKLLGAKPEKPLISKANLRKVFTTIPAKQYATKQKLYDSIMCFSKFLVESSKLTEQQRSDIKTLKPKRFIPAERPTLSEKQIEQLLGIVSSLKGTSLYCKQLTKTIIIFLRETGLRASELCNLKLEDISLENRTVHVWLGKGNKNRRVGLTARSYEALSAYLKGRLDLQTESPYFFINEHGEQMTRNSLRQKWNRLSRHTGFRITSHAFRRSFVTLNVQKGRNLIQMQLMCGHSDIKTTRGYCTTSEDMVIEDMKGW